MIKQFDPPHPGEFLKQVYLAPLNLTIHQTAKHLNVHASTLNRIVNGQSDISPEMAIRLEVVFGRSADSWLHMQNNFDLSKTRQAFDISALVSIHIDEPAL